MLLFNKPNIYISPKTKLKLVTEHSEAERDKPKLEKKIQTCEERIHYLEQKLRESEKERHRYQNEANRIKEMMQRNVMSTRHAAQIGEFQRIRPLTPLLYIFGFSVSVTNTTPPVQFLAKPIRAGQSGIINRSAVAQAK